MKKKRFLQIKIGNDICPARKKDLKIYRKYFKKFFRKYLKSDVMFTIGPHCVEIKEIKFKEK